MKKIIISIYIVILLTIYTGCSQANLFNDSTVSTDSSVLNDNSNTTAEEISTLSTDSSMVSDNLQNTYKSNNKYESFGAFSEGLAWVEYDDYFGCINEKGKMLFAYSKNAIDSVTDFENGYSFLRHKSDTRTVSVIDYTGKILKTFSNCKEYGYGLAIIENYQTGFDKSVYEYEICDVKGNVIDSCTAEDSSKELSISYYGDGVFLFCGSEFYCAKNSKWISDYAESWRYFENFAFNKDGRAFITISSSFISAKSTGEFVEVSNNSDDIYLEGHTLNRMVYGDTAYLYSDDGRVNSHTNLFAYNTSKEKIYALNDEAILKHLYTTHVAGDYDMLVNPSINQNGLIVQLIGEDSYDYVAVLSNTLKTVISPVKKTGEYCALSSGNYFLNHNVYDKNGKELFSADFEDVISDSEKITIVRDYEGTVCENGDSYIMGNKSYRFYAVDNKGEIVFEGIDSSSVEIKQIP